MEILETGAREKRFHFLGRWWIGRSVDDAPPLEGEQGEKEWGEPVFLGGRFRCQIDSIKNGRANPEYDLREYSTSMTHIIFGSLSL